MTRHNAHLLFLPLLLLATTACTSRAKYATMRQGLDSLNTLNRASLPFAPADVLPYTTYFDRHGTANDQLLAHYLLGRAHHEQGDAPIALQCYQEAIEHADTTADNCDFAQLSRVYGQMSDIFYDQGLYSKQLQQLKHAARFAKKGCDTISCITYEELQSLPYKRIGLRDSAITILKKAAVTYKKMGHYSQAALALGGTVLPLIEQNRFLEAKKNMYIFETEAGVLDSAHNITINREIYYYLKGVLCLHEEKIDSAEYWFRKELSTAKDFNNQNAGALGLAKLFQYRHNADSAIKYYQQAHAIKDSILVTRENMDIARLQAMYDYSRHQKTAQQAKEREMAEKEKLHFTLTTFTLLTILTIIFIYWQYKKQKKNASQFRQTLLLLEQTQTEMMLLKGHENDFRQLIKSKEQQIEELKLKLHKYSTKITHNKTEKNLKDTPEYQKLAAIAYKGIPLKNEDFRIAHMLLIEYFPTFNDLITSRRHNLNINEYHSSVLFRLHFKSKEISNLLCISQARVSQICTELMEKLFEEHGGAKEFVERISKIY